jgi:hypothetical protein
VSLIQESTCLGREERVDLRCERMRAGGREASGVASGKNAGCLRGYLYIGALWYDRCGYIG